MARGLSGLIVRTRAEEVCSTVRETVYHPNTREICHARTIRKKAGYAALNHVRVSQNFYMAKTFNNFLLLVAEQLFRDLFSDQLFDPLIYLLIDEL